MQEGREGGERLHRHTRSSDWSIHEQSLMEEEWQLSFVEITQTSHKEGNFVASNLDLTDRPQVLVHL